MCMLLLMPERWGVSYSWLLLLSFSLKVRVSFSSLVSLIDTSKAAQSNVSMYKIRYIV